MTTISAKQFSLLVGLAALTAIGSSLPAYSQTLNSEAAKTKNPASLQVAELDSTNKKVEIASPVIEPLPVRETNKERSTLTATAPIANTTIPAESFLKPEAAVPGTTLNSANGLMEKPTSGEKIAQLNVRPGRPTQSGFSYIGVGGNIGFTNNGTALGRGNFAIISKIGLTETLSFRPAAVLGDQTVILLPLTYDFNLRSSELIDPVPYAPFLGLGASVSTGGNSQVGLLVTGGVDVPLSRDFTANATVNASFANRTEVGLILGLGYNFLGF